MFQEGGMFSYVVFGFGILTWGFAFLALLPHIMKGSKQRMALIALGSVVVICGGLALIAGLIGWSYGISQMEQAMMYASPESVDMIRVQGSEMAFIPVKIWSFAVLPFIFGIATVIRGISMGEILSVD